VLRDTLRKLWSPNLEKALTFLDDSLLPATSNAVERANRRHRKMQKSIYRVRTRDHISQRIAIDMWRDEYRVGFKKTITPGDKIPTHFSAQNHSFLRSFAA
jgi:hypothetical protein